MARALIITLALLARTAGAQSGDDFTLRSALQARAIIQRAVDALGGRERLERIKTLTREFDVTYHDPGQGLRPALGVRIPPSNAPGHNTHIVDLRERRSFTRRSALILGGQPFSLRTVLAPGRGFTTNDSTRRVDDFSAADADARFDAQLRLNPETLLLVALRRPESLRWLGPTGGARPGAQAVTFSAADGEQVTVAFDDATGLPHSQRSVGTGAALGDQEVVVEFDDWRPAGDVRLPFRQREWRNGVLYLEQRLTSARIDEPVADSLFARPTGYDPPPTRASAPTPLGDGVFALEGAYNSMAVVFRDYVIVVEPGASEATTQRNIATIAKLAPGKPIRYVVATHFHYDHLAGVRGYVAAGATVVTTAHARDVLTSILRAPRSLRPDATGPVTKEPTVEVVRRSRAFTDGEQVLVLHDVGPSPHATEILIAYLPRQRVLFEGDLLDLDIPAAGTAMPGDDSAELAASIMRLGLEVDRIVPVHGRLGSSADLTRALARRTRR